MKSKVSSNEQLKFKKYHLKCRKPSVVDLVQGSKGKASKKSKGVQIQIEYDPISCLISKASRSDGRWVGLSYDDSGHIGQMKDQSGRVINIDWNLLVNKPHKISQKGVGSVVFQYDKKTGEAKGLAKGGDPIVITQVMRSFNGFLEIISPIASETSI